LIGLVADCSQRVAQAFQRVHAQADACDYQKLPYNCDFI
jgi:hypothetical protein